MKRGQVITAAILDARFDKLFRKLNNLSAFDFNGFSSGQVFIYGRGGGVNSEVLSTSCEQYFDTQKLKSYTLYEDGGVKTYNSVGFLESLLYEIKTLENR